MFSWFSHLSDISDQAMKAIWDRSPRDFQKEAIPRLLMMRCPPHRPEAMLLVQGTGGGKSAVAQTVGCVEYGVRLLLKPPWRSLQISARRWIKHVIHMVQFWHINLTQLKSHI